METSPQVVSTRRVHSKRNGASGHLDAWGVRRGTAQNGVGMTALTIPRELARRDDLVVVPRKAYEALLQSHHVREFSPTVAQRKALVRAERNLKLGKSLSYDELTRALGFTD